MMEKGNHKSAEKEPNKVAELLTKHVAHGFSIPVSLQTVEKIKGAMVQPLGLATQFTLAKNGSRKVKTRLTQDLSFSLTEPGVSVNSGIDMDLYPEMFYGWCMSRTIHFSFWKKLFRIVAIIKHFGWIVGCCEWQWIIRYESRDNQ
jgi:hypothetical protein